MTTHLIEKKFIEAFIVSIRRARYLEAFGNRKKRIKTLDRLNHFIDDLDSRYRVPIPRNKQTARDIGSMLATKGALSECYVISSWGKLDGKTMDLTEALNSVIGYGMGTVISCVHGQLAYYEAEDPGERFILERTAG